MAYAEIDLVVAGLVPPEAAWARAVAPAALGRLFARASRAPFGPPSYESALFSAFAVPRPGGALPVAPYTFRVDHGVAPDGAVMRADPVHLVADGVHLGVAAVAPPPAPELKAWEAVLAPVFEARAIAFSAPHPSRWYLRLPAVPALRTTPLPVAHGRDAGQHLFAGDDARAWRVVWNEVQMVLHASDLNAARERAGLAPINSVWFWGEGVLPAQTRVPFSRVWADEALARGVAMAAGVPCAVPADGARLVDDAAGRGLLALDLRGPLQRSRSMWEDAVNRFDEQTCEPLLAALARGRLARLRLWGENGVCYTVTRAGLRRFWLRAVPLEREVARGA